MASNKRKLAELPTSVNISGKKFKIVYTDDMDLSTYGETIGPEYTIKIASRHSKERMVSTLLHEMMHAALYVGGLSEVLDDNMEEGVVVCLENALYDTYKNLWL